MALITLVNTETGKRWPTASAICSPAHDSAEVAIGQAKGMYNATVGEPVAGLETRYGFRLE
jgi:hypothetical protein